MPEPLDFLRGGGGGKINMKSPLLSQWKDRQASRKAVTQGGKPGRGCQLHFALQPFLSCGNRASTPKGQPVQGYGEACGGDAGFSGESSLLLLLEAAMQGMDRKGEHPESTKRKASYQPFGGWCGAFLFVGVLFVEKLGVLMTDKGGFL